MSEGPCHAALTRDREGLSTAELMTRLMRVTTVAAEHVDMTDEQAVFPVSALDELRTTGLLGLLVPTEHGGLGGNIRDVLTASIELGRTDMSLAMIFAMHCQQVAALVEYAGPELTGMLLPQIAAGRVYLASVTTETGKGGHLLSAQTQLVATRDQLAIDRFAPIVTGGAHADGFLISMQSPWARSASEVSLVYAHRDQLEITMTGDWQPLGMRASHSVALRMTGSIPEHQVVGEHGAFRRIVLESFGPLAHLGWSACWLGTAAGALSRVLKLLRSPAGRNGVNLDSELLLTRVSRARQRLDTVNALLWHTLGVINSTTEISAPRIQLLLNALKITASEQCHAAVEDLIDTLGLRHGYLRNSVTRLERSLRDLRSAALNYSNDRLHLADGKLALLDPEVRFVQQ